MLTAFTIEDKTEQIWYKRLINLLKHDEIKVKINQVSSIALRHIIYVSKRGKINYKAIDRKADLKSQIIICGKDVFFPPRYSVKRFFGHAFTGRMCINMMLDILMKSKDCGRISVGLYDLTGVHANVLRKLLKYTSNVKVVTNAVDQYMYVSELIMEEQGASVFVSQDEKSLADCTVVISPDKIFRFIPAAQNCIVLTSVKPAVCLSGLVYYKYSFEMPKVFEEVKPQELSDDYFCNALYTLEQQYDLGTIVPKGCYNESSSQTTASIIGHIRACL